ncbi:MAG TPA: hypothetical protein VEV38_00755 [Candidatus Eremiobacteraceae bacterium]|nr:hypothetical protein [Candidatus Eremiobacteraceae bacterium]
MIAAFASLALGVAIRSAPSPAGSPPTPIAAQFAEISFAVPSQVFSSADVVGTLAITNASGEDLGYSPTMVSFLIRQPNGAQREQPMITIIGHPFSPFWISAGERREFRITMPSCEVIADPCSEKVALKFYLTTRSWQRIEFETDEKAYRKVADPTSTFEVAGLTGDRPLILARGEAEGEINRDTAEFRFDYTGDDHALSAAVTAAFTHAGLTTASIGEVYDKRVYTATSSGPPGEGQVSAAVTALQKTFGYRISNIETSYVATDLPENPVFERARSVATSAGAPVANFLGVEPTQGAFIPGDGTAVQLSNSAPDDNPYDDSPLSWVSRTKLVFDFSLTLGQRAATPTPFWLRVRDTEALVGESRANPPELGSRLSGLDYLATNRVDPLALRPVIEADQTEVFAIAETTEEESERVGLDADAVAVSLARRRASYLATVLGLHEDSVSLVAAYPHQDWTEGARLVPAGVAVKTGGDNENGWRRLAAPLPKQPSQNGITMSESPMPIPRSLSTYNFTPPPDAQPIDVADASTTIESSAAIPVNASADEFRVEVVAEFSGDPTGYGNPPGVPSVEAVLSTLSEFAPASSIVVEPSGNGSVLPVGYGFTIRGNDWAQAVRAVGAVRSTFPSAATVWHYAVEPNLGNCSAAIAAGLRASAADDVDSALRSATQSGERLRHLILAAAYLPDTEHVCENSAHDFYTGEVTGTTLAKPANMNVSIYVPVKLVFRTTTGVRSHS